MGAAIAALFTALLPLIQYWIANSPARVKEAADEADQTLRNECNNLDAGAISLRIDEAITADNSTGVGNGGTQSGATGTE